MRPYRQLSKETNVTMTIRQKLAVAGAGVLSLVGVGGGVALAQSGPSSTANPPAASTPAPTQAAAPETTAAPEKPEAPNAPEAPEAAAEKQGPEEPGDANLPGGGHADPAGQNVDHQFEGQE
jgi:hypothetical protein